MVNHSFTESQDTPLTASRAFKKSQRLLNPSEYGLVFGRKAIKASRPEILLLATWRHEVENPGESKAKSQARLGLVVAKKHIRLAANRNRFKRVVRESFRHHQLELRGLNIVVLARAGADKLDNAELHRMVSDLWKQLLKRAARMAPTQEPTSKR